MSIVLAVALVAVMTVSAFAVDTSRVYLQPQVWCQNSTDWSNWTCLQTASGAAQIDLGDTMDVVFIGDAWKGIEAPTYVYGLQILDGTISQDVAVDGDQTKIKYEISDIVFKATGYDDYVVSCAGVYEEELTVKMESWGPSNNYGDDITFDFTAVAGGSDGASLTAYFQAIETVSFTITYLEYNGEGPAVEDAPAVEEPVEEAPAEEAPAEGDASVEVALYFGNSVDGAFNHGEPVAITGPGEYTFTYSGIGHLAFDMTVLFIKDVAVEDKLATSTNLPADTEIITKSVKINGQEIALTEGYPTTLTDSGVFDVCYFNTWATSYFSTSGLGTIDNAEVVVEIKYTEEAPAVEDTPAVEEPKEEKPADTGLALAVVPMIVAAAAVVLSKKR